MKSSQIINKPILVMESPSDCLSTGSWRFVLRLKPIFNLWRREGREGLGESESWALRSSRPLGGVPGREGEGEEEEEGTAESEATKELLDLGWGMVFRLTTGESSDSAKDTRLEETWRLSSGRGIRMGARSTRAELRRTWVETEAAPVEDDADLRWWCLCAGRGFLTSEVSEGAMAVKDAGKSHPNQMARRLWTRLLSWRVSWLHRRTPTTAKPKEPIARADKRTKVEVRASAAESGSLVDLSFNFWAINKRGTTSWMAGILRTSEDKWKTFAQRLLL